MRFTGSLTLLTVIAAGLNVGADVGLTPRTRFGSEANMRPENLTIGARSPEIAGGLNARPQGLPTGIRSPGPQANAKRLAIGLPPLPPRRATPRFTGPRSMESPVLHSCNILIKDASTLETLGYMAPIVNTYGEYGIIQDSQAGAMAITFSTTSDSTTGLSLKVSNDPSDASAGFPYMGAALNSNNRNDDLDSSFIWLAATQQATTGPQPETGLDSFNTIGPDVPGYRDTFLYYETAIWSWDSVSGALTVSWTNADGSVVTPPFSYYQDPDPGEQYIVLSTSIYTQEYYETVTLTCV